MSPFCSPLISSGEGSCGITMLCTGIHVGKREVSIPSLIPCNSNWQTNACGPNPHLPALVNSFTGRQPCPFIHFSPVDAFAPQLTAQLRSCDEQHISPPKALRCLLLGPLRKSLPIPALEEPGGAHSRVKVQSIVRFA